MSGRILFDNQASKGMFPAFNPEESFPSVAGYELNSWFYIGHYELGGHKINYLYHQMIMALPGAPALVVSDVSFTDETEGWCAAGDVVIPLERAERDASVNRVKVPNGLIEGTLKKCHIQAELGTSSLDLTLESAGNILYNAGSGLFPLLGMEVHQYSVPAMKTNGTLTVRGKTYDIRDGDTWFDRQWQHMNEPVQGRWTWMDLNLDNGERVSLWGAVNRAGEEHSWATILHPDGSLVVVGVEPLSQGESRLWTSERSGWKYPTQWVVRIPEYDAVLDVTPSPMEQEVVSVMEPLNKYEGASSVKGTWQGKNVTGHCYVELVGQWKDWK
jgi:predicted secreted hydrolase